MHATDDTPDADDGPLPNPDGPAAAMPPEHLHTALRRLRAAKGAGLLTGPRFIRLLAGLLSEHARVDPAISLPERAGLAYFRFRQRGRRRD